MAQVRFLDQVPVTAYASNIEQASTPGRLPRVLFAGETLVVQPNQQIVGFDFYIQEGALVEIKGWRTSFYRPISVFSWFDSN